MLIEISEKNINEMIKLMHLGTKHRDSSISNSLRFSELLRAIQQGVKKDKKVEKKNGDKK